MFAGAVVQSFARTQAKEMLPAGKGIFAYFCCRLDKSKASGGTRPAVAKALAARPAVAKALAARPAVAKALAARPAGFMPWFLSPGVAAPLSAFSGDWYFRLPLPTPGAHDFWIIPIGTGALRRWQIARLAI